MSSSSPTITVVVAQIADRDADKYFGVRGEIDRIVRQRGRSCFWLRGWHGSDWFMMLDTTVAECEADLKNAREMLDSAMKIREENR